MFKTLLVLRYLSSVSTRQTEFNDKDRLGGDDGVRGGVGRRGDDWICAAFSCYRRIKSGSDSTI